MDNAISHKLQQLDALLPLEDKDTWLNAVAAATDDELTALLFRWLEQDSLRMRLLTAAERLNLPNWCLSAGFVLNLVWDRLHGLNSTLNDIDLIYFDAANCSKAFERECEQQLTTAIKANWSVKNQARMHLKHGHAPYQSVAHAMSYWPELETAIAVTRCRQRLQLIDNYALRSLMSLHLTPNPQAQFALFQQRVQAKGWLLKYQYLSL